MALARQFAARTMHARKVSHSYSLPASVNVGQHRHLSDVQSHILRQTFMLQSAPN